jgi:hypothetical protein
MPPLRTLAGAVAGFSILAVTVYACAPTPDHTTVDDPVAACLADAGQDSSLVNLDKRRLEDAAFNGAFEACAAAIGLEVLPPGEETRRINQRVRELLTCLRDAGWDIPEPERGEHGVLDIAGYDEDVADDRFPEFQVDRQLCLDMLETSPSSHEHDDHEHDHDE